MAEGILGTGRSHRQQDAVSIEGGPVSPQKKMASEGPGSGVQERSNWSGKWGFILAAAASAVGLGNLWRFPYLAAKYGGGAFLLVYLILVITFGFALMMGETALGRMTGLSTIGAFKQFGKKFAFIGVLASLVPFTHHPPTTASSVAGSASTWCPISRHRPMSSQVTSTSRDSSSTTR